MHERVRMLVSSIPGGGRAWCGRQAVAGLEGAQVQSAWDSIRDAQCAGDAQAHDDVDIKRQSKREGRGHRLTVVQADPRRVSGLRREVAR